MPAATTSVTANKLALQASRRYQPTRNHVLINRYLLGCVLTTATLLRLRKMRNHSIHHPMAQAKKKTIASMRADADKLTFAMQMFCLNPSYETYKEISACPAIARNEGENLVIWQISTLYKHGSAWVDLDPEIKRTQSKTEFVWMCQNEEICNKLIPNPSQKLAMQVIHMFFATGELRYIDLFYQTMGNAKLAVKTRNYIADVYVAVRRMYVNKCQELLAKDANHFTRIGMRRDVADFSYFSEENIAARVKQEKKANAERAQTANIFGPK